MKRVVILLILATGFLLTNAQEGYKVGDIAKDFKLMNVDGKYVSLADYKAAKGYVVIFSCNHCPYVKAYEERMIQLHNDYAPKGFPVVAINSNDPSIVPKDSYENMKIRAKEKNFPFAYLVDKEHAIQEIYGAKRTPHVYLLQKTKKDLVVRYIGTIDDSPMNSEGVKVKYLQDAIESLLKGQEPDPNYTKAIGCSIKKKKT